MIELQMLRKNHIPCKMFDAHKQGLEFPLRGSIESINHIASTSLILLSLGIPLIFRNSYFNPPHSESFSLQIKKEEKS